MPQGDANVRSLAMLSAPNPRCNLKEMYKKVRQIVLWIQTKQNSKKLGDLYFSETLKAIADDADTALGIIIFQSFTYFVYLIFL